MPPLKILVRSTNWIGDAIMTTPALGLLCHAFPKARISVLAKPWVQAVFSAHPSVAGLIGLESDGMAQRLSTVMRIKKRGFDMAVLFPNSFDSALLTWLARIPVRAGFATDARRFLLNMPVEVPEDKEKRHQVFYYAKLVAEVAKRVPGAEKVDLDGFVPELFLKVPDAGMKAAKKRLEDAGMLGTGRPLVGLNPGAAYGPAKCWPTERYADLGLRLQEALGSCHVFVLGTAKEEGIGDEICRPLGEFGHNLAGKTSLEEVMGLIAHLDLLVTNDSGLMHVGAALGTRLVAIFGSTNPITTGPWSRKAKVVRHDLPCSPCLRRDCPEDFMCMRGIEVQEVLDACLEMLSGAESG